MEGPRRRPQTGPSRSANHPRETLHAAEPGRASGRDAEPADRLGEQRMDPRCARAGRGAPDRGPPVLGRPRLVIPAHGTDTAGNGGVDTRGMRLSRIERLVVMVGALGLLLWTAAAVAAV